jgi:hypothetical protein
MLVKNCVTSNNIYIYIHIKGKAVPLRSIEAHLVTGGTAPALS